MQSELCKSVVRKRYDELSDQIDLNHEVFIAKAAYVSTYNAWVEKAVPDSELEAQYKLYKRTFIGFLPEADRKQWELSTKLVAFEPMNGFPK